MRDGQNRAVKVRQRRLQHLGGGDVEIVGRLVQQQQIGALQHQGRQLQAAALAAAERGHRQTQLFVVKLVFEQEGDRVVFGHGADVPHALQRRALQPGAEGLVVLRVVAGLRPGADANLPLQRGLLAQHQTKKDGLAGAVGADQPDALAMPQEQVQVDEEQRVVVAHRQARDLQRLRAAAPAAELRLQLTSLDDLLDHLALFFHALQHPPPVPRLAFVARVLGDARPVLKAFDGLLDLADAFLLRRVLLLLPQARQFALRGVPAVVAGPDLQHTRLQFDDLPDHLVQQPAVVRNDDDGALVVADKGL